MEPFCELCSSRHHPKQAHRWQPSRFQPKTVPVRPVTDVTDGVTDGREVSGAAKRMKKWREAHPEEAKAKDREAARRYRERRRDRARAGFQP